MAFAMLGLPPEIHVSGLLGLHHSSPNISSGRSNMAFATLGLRPEMYISGLLWAYLDVKATKEFQRCVVIYVTSGSL